MNKPKHTPGPWAVCDDDVSVYADGEDVIVSTCPDEPAFGAQTQEELEANAHLIAAAPDLLKALTTILAKLHRAEAAGHVPHRTLVMCEKAIAKATGGTK